ncbi:MAG TPA: Crp/Fnr family transcriptional regulator [Clostridiaceae bacterium]|nr:Crp/Fnr family transcriptional regulator [Clostridiaceae bacterium]
MLKRINEIEDLNKYTSILIKSILFKGIGKDEISSMIYCLDPKICTYKKNEYIALAGDRYIGVGILVNGSASISKEKFSGSRIIMKIIEPGELFGEIIAFSNEANWPVTIQALEESTVFFFGKDKITGSCSRNCPWHMLIIENMLRIVSERAILLNKKVEYLSIKSIRGKISTYLLEQYKKTGNKIFMLPLKRVEMAEFLNVSRPSMSREMCRMRDEGIIDFHRSSVRIIDLDALKKMAES